MNIKQKAFKQFMDYQVEIAQQLSPIYGEDDLCKVFRRYGLHIKRNYQLGVSVQTMAEDLIHKPID